MSGTRNPKPAPALTIDPALVARYLKYADTDREKTRGQKVRHILSSAAKLFATEGVAGVSMRQIAADAGVTLSTLQHYFGNRENLVHLTINSLLATYIADFTAISRDTSRPAVDRFVQVMDELLGAVDAPVIEAFYVHLWAAAVQDESIRSHIRESYTRYFDALGALVGQMRPDWSVERVAATALAIGTQIDGLLVARAIGPHNLPPSPVVALQVKEFWLKSILEG